MSKSSFDDLSLKEGNKKSHLSKDLQSLRDGSKNAVPAVPLSLPGGWAQPLCTISLSRRMGESLLHDNGQTPSAPKGVASQHGSSGASDAIPSPPPRTIRRLSEAGCEIAFSPSWHFLNMGALYQLPPLPVKRKISQGGGRGAKRGRAESSPPGPAGFCGIWDYTLFQNRYSITANWARVALPVGFSVPALVPPMMPPAVAHCRGSTA